MLPRALAAVARLLMAVLLMAIAVWIVGPDRLRQQWAQVRQGWFLAALLVVLLSQAVSVLRWGAIARIFGLRVRLQALALAYAQGMTINALLPGATMGGDALRSVRLQALGNPLAVAALTVLLDRLSGLWVLCVLSLLTGLGLVLVFGAGMLGGAVLHPAGGGLPWLTPGQWVWIYLAGLAILCALPALPLHARAAPAADPRRDAGLLRRVLWRLGELHDLAQAQRRPLGRSLWSSVVVQVLCAIALWLCVRAAGGQAQYWQVQAVAAPVFVAGALPLSYGGFGARELTALAVFPLVGLPGDLGLAASLLYGALGLVLGLAAAPAFAFPAPRAPVAPGA